MASHFRKNVGQFKNKNSHLCPKGNLTFIWIAAFVISVIAVLMSLGRASLITNQINNRVAGVEKLREQLAAGEMSDMVEDNFDTNDEIAGLIRTFQIMAKDMYSLLDIENMVKEMQTAVSLGVSEMVNCTKEVEQSVEDVYQISIQIGSRIDQVQALTPRFEMVSEGMDTQSQSAYQISEAMDQLSEASTQVADSLRDINNAIAGLNNVAQGLRQEISSLKVA